MNMKWTGAAGLTAVVMMLTACTTDEAQSAATTTSDAPHTVVAVSNTAGKDLPPVTVYKDPNCGCCANWVDHMKAAGFNVTTVERRRGRSEERHGIGSELQSCHTAIIGDYAIEGHVPADLIVKLMTEKPTIAGLAVPGMPAGSPGMEGATKERYDILTFDRAGRTTVYAQR